MKLPHRTLASLPPALLFLTTQIAAQALVPTALRKMTPDENEKFFPEYVAFAPGAEHPSYHAAMSPREALLALRGAEPEEAHSIPRYRPPFKLHDEEASEWDLFRRAAEAVKLLSKREACPDNMNSCEELGHPNKCCFEGESCVEVDDSTVGNVACCPDGVTCNGGVGECPVTAVTCPADLGGGCCIQGYICKGLGCVLSSASSTQTLTTTSTTTVNGAPSTVIVTIVTTITNDPGAVTSTRTSIVSTTPTPTDSDEDNTPTTSNAGAPFRPTSTDADSPGAGFNLPSGDFCPVGYYACLARAGGGCCRTGRDCATTSCPPTPMTTIISGSITVAVPVTDVPDGEDIRTCATGWYLCGDEGGPVAGCCPDGYGCGTASCTLATPEETAEIQKSFPSGARPSGSGIGGFVTALVALSMGVLFSPW